MAWRPHGRAKVNVGNQDAFAVCDRCYLLYNKSDLQWQYDWRGPRLMNLRILVCRICLDKPQEQLRPRILPPDPVPVFNPRPENYYADDGDVAYAGSGDLIPGAQAWYGLRAYSNAIATARGKAIRIQRPSDGAQMDIGVLPTGFLDWPTAWNFSNGVPCTIVTVYDQTGHGFDLTQPAPGGYPTLLFNGVGDGQPVMSFNGSQGIMSATAPNIPEPVSLSIVWMEAIGGNNAGIMFGSNNQNGPDLSMFPDGPQLGTVGIGGTASFETRGDIGRWHTTEATGSGANSYMTVDGIVTFGDASSSGITSPLSFGYYSGDQPDGSFHGSVIEGGVWGFAFSTGMLTALTKNQSNWWRIPIASSHYTGPGDAVPGAVGWWGLRAYSKSAVGSIIRVRRQSDNVEADIGTVDGNLDLPTLITFLAGSAGFVRTLYDQSPNGNDLVQATPANQPVLQLNALNGRPVIAMDGTQYFLSAANLNQSSPLSLSAVYKAPTDPPPNVDFVILGGTSSPSLQMYLGADAGQVSIGGASLGISTPSPLKQWNAVVGVANGPSSILFAQTGSPPNPLDLTIQSVDNDASILGPVSVGFGDPGYDGGPPQFIGQFIEAGVWPVAITGEQVSQLAQNERRYWGF